MEVIFLVINFRINLRYNSKFLHNCTPKNLVLSVCYCWNETVSLRRTHKKFLHGGRIGYGESCLDAVFRYFKVFRLQAILHDANGAVRLQTGKGPGYCCMVGRGPNCCLLGHVTGLLFCILGKKFLHFIFDLLDSTFETVCL